MREQKRADLIPFDPHSFDLVTAACVYHHVRASERLRLTQSVHNSLRPGGLFAIFEHNPWNPVTRAIVRRSPIDVNAILLYPSESVALLKEAGFVRISLQYFLLVPETAAAKMAWVERWLRRIPFWKDPHVGMAFSEAPTELGAGQNERQQRADSKRNSPIGWTRDHDNSCQFLVRRRVGDRGDRPH